MRLSISVADHSWPEGPAAIGPRISRIAQAADQAGFDTLWAMDHMFQIPIHGPATDPLLEAYSLLGFVAGQTSRIRLGTMVTAVSYRHPGLLIKSVTALDVLSQGRLWLGLGTGWNDVEARAFGLPFPGLSERYERLEETLRIAHQVWSGDDGPFVGKHYRLENPFNNPNALQRPHPPILIGGMGERKTFRLVAEYADACNLMDIPEGAEFAGMRGGPAMLRRKLELLREHCETVGRPYGEIEKTIVSTSPISATGEGDTRSPAQLVEHYGRLAELGFEHVVFESSGPWTEESLDLYASIVPDVRRL